MGPAWRRQSGRHRGWRGSVGRPVVAPEDSSTHEEQQRDDDELGRTDPLLALVPVIPRRDQDDREADQQRQGRELLNAVRPVEGVRDVFQALQKAPGTRGIDEPHCTTLRRCSLSQRPCPARSAGDSVSCSLSPTP